MENEFSLNINLLASALQINSIDIKTLRENEERIKYYKTLKNYSPLLLYIASNVNKEFSDEISLHAAIQLKNFINSYWDNFPTNNNNNANEENIIINEEDKNYIREKILDSVKYIVEIRNNKILKQLNQCVKKIFKYDYKKNNTDYIKFFMNKVIDYLQKKDLNQIYAGIILFHQLSKIYEFDNEEKQKIYNQELIKVNDYLLSSLYECKDINNLIQAQFAYKIIKIFFKSFQGSIPELFVQEKIFEQWINYILNVIKTPLNQNNINNDKTMFFKLKRICYQTITRIIQKYSRYASNNQKNPFEAMISNKYVSIFFDLYRNIFINNFNNPLFIDDYGKTCIYIFFCILMENGKFNKLVLDIFINEKNNELLNNIINDCFLTYDELKLWSTDPKRYLSEKVEEMNSILTKRYNSSKLFSLLFAYKENKKSKPKYHQSLFEFLRNTLIQENDKLNLEKQSLLNNNNPYHLIYNNINFCLRKESIIYLIKNNDTTIKKYLKNEIETFIEKIIFPELNSSCGFLREQACAFIKYFRSYKYTNTILVENLAKCFINLMINDPFLPVRFESSMALSVFLNQENVKELIKGNIQIILAKYLKLMEETDLEEIMDSLQEIVINFTEECKNYIVELSEYLIKYFKELIINIHEEDKESIIDDFSLINNIIRTFSNFIHYFVNNENIYPKIEKHIDILLDFCINQEPYDKLEDGINLLEEILTNCQNLPKHVWKFFLPLIKIFIGNNPNLNENNINEQINEEFGLENILDINKMICYYISKDDGTIFNLVDDKGNQYLFYIIKYIKIIMSICEENKNYGEYIFIFDICNILFDKYKEKVELIAVEMLNTILLKFENQKNEKLSIYLCFLLSICFMYYPDKTLKYFQIKNKTKEILMFWFFEIDKLKNYQQIKYNLFGICSLISLDKNQQDKLVSENIKLFIEKILNMIDKVLLNIQKEEKKKEKKEKKEKEKNKKEETDENDESLDDDELFRKFVEGKDISDDEDDEEWDENEDNQDDLPLTAADKESPILIVKKTFELNNKKDPELFKTILIILGDNTNKLKDIFEKEELRLKNNGKK